MPDTHFDHGVQHRYARTHARAHTHSTKSKLSLRLPVKLISPFFKVTFPERRRVEREKRRRGRYLVSDNNLRLMTLVSGRRAGCPQKTDREMAFKNINIAIFHLAQIGGGS